MTDQHPITPPPELVAKLWREASAGRDDAPIGEIFNHGVYLAYAAGADQELEACLNWLDRNCGRSEIPASLQEDRRPNPPSLKERIAAAITDGDERTALSLLNEAMPNV